MHDLFSRLRWPKERLQAVNEIKPKYQYIVFEDFSIIGDFNVMFFDTSHVLGNPLHLKRRDQEDAWYTDDPTKPFHLKDLDTVIAEHIGCEAGLIQRVPLLLPFTCKN